MLEDLYNEQQALFRDNAQQDPARFIAIGEARTESLLDPAGFAALTVVCQAIMNLDATIHER